MSGLYTERSGPQHGYQFCQAKDRKFWICNFESGAVYNGTPSLSHHESHIDNHAGTKVQLLEKAFVYSVSVSK